MITKLLFDTTIGYKREAELLRAGTPVAFRGFEPGDRARIELPDGRIVEVEAAVVAAHETEETLTVLAERVGVGYATLARAARDGRLLARQSGVTWLSTGAAVEAALKQGRLRPRS